MLGNLYFLVTAYATLGIINYNKNYKQRVNYSFVMNGKINNALGLPIV